VVSLESILNILKINEKRIRSDFRVKEIAIFGSIVKGKQKKKSDIDILIDFEKGYKIFDNYMELKFFLEEILGTKVDLVIKTAIRDEIKDYILSEAIYV
jgi:hypothetical protein